MAHTSLSGRGEVGIRAGQHALIVLVHVASGTGDTLLSVNADVDQAVEVGVGSRFSRDFSNKDRKRINVTKIVDSAVPSIKVFPEIERSSRWRSHGEHSSVWSR